MRFQLDPTSPSGLSVAPEPQRTTNRGGFAGSPDITRVLQPGTNVTFTGNGTQQSPYVVNASGGGGAWGTITGTLSDQTDLQTVLNAKQATITNSDSITEGSSHLFLTTTERTKLSTTSGTNTGDQTSISGNAGTASNLSGTPALPNGVTATTQSAADNSTKLATTAYTDSAVAAAVQGLSIKQSVQEATAVALPTNTYLAGVITITATGVLTVDGQTVALNDRVLVKNEAAQANNGIYLCTTAGAVGIAAVLTRATDSNTGAKILGGFTFVETGTANADSGFVNTNTTAPTIGTTAITYTQFSGAGEIIAGTGLGKSGNTLSIDTAVTVDKTTVQILTNKTLTSPAITTPTGIVKGDVGLGNVDNTSDTTKNAATVTLTNKRITPRVVAVTQSATPTINTDNTDVASITGLAQAITSMTTNLSGTAVDGDKLIIRITDNGTARAITWGASFEASTVGLPSTTTISTLLMIGFVWNTVTSKWRCVAIA